MACGLPSQELSTFVQTLAVFAPELWSGSFRLLTTRQGGRPSCMVSTTVLASWLTHLGGRETSPAHMTSRVLFSYPHVINRPAPGLSVAIHPAPYRRFQLSGWNLARSAGSCLLISGLTTWRTAWATPPDTTRHEPEANHGELGRSPRRHAAAFKALRSIYKANLPHGIRHRSDAGTIVVQ